MRRRTRNHRGNQSEEFNFWPSFTDLLSSILLFIVVFMLIINAVKSAQLSKNQQDLEVKEQTIEDIQKRLDYFNSIEKTIGNKLSSEFEDSGLDLTVDSKTGTIKFRGDFFFDTDKTELKPELKSQLAEFVPKYLNILLGEDLKEYIAEIIVEGHTDNVESYMYNLNLSQGRAYSVVSYILDEDFPGQYDRDALMPIITANGKSYSDLIFNEDGSVNMDESRRVEFKFRLKDYKMLEEIFNDENF